MEAAETRMNVFKDSVRAEDVGTLKGTLNVFVLQAFIHLQTRDNVLITMNADRRGCVPMETVSTWMEHLNVSVCQDSNFLSQDCLVWTLTSVWRIQEYV